MVVLRSAIFVGLCAVMGLSPIPAATADTSMAPCAAALHFIHAASAEGQFDRFRHIYGAARLRNRIFQEENHDRGQFASTFYRVHKYAAHWQSADINQTIPTLLGPEVMAVQSGKKIIYFPSANTPQQTDLAVIEDPVGRYFRVFHRRHADGHIDTPDYCGLNGETPDINNPDEFQRLTHFDYSRLYSRQSDANHSEKPAMALAR
jgi:hypothetical protein